MLGSATHGMPAHGSTWLGKTWLVLACQGGARRGRETTEGKLVRAPFEPVGKQARWRVIYELLKAKPVNGLLSYDEMGDALGLHPERDRNVIQQAMHRAAKEHEQVDKRAVDAVSGKGYRVVEVPEHIGLARRHQKRAGRSLVRGHSKAVNVDLNGVDPQVRAALETIGKAFVMQMDFNKRFEAKQGRLEETIRDIADTQAEDRKRTADEVAELRERLARLEAGQ
jgi:polyhydroxyalkanoate synthesis regulator phasin